MTSVKYRVHIVVAALLGLGLSAWLTYIHIRVHLDPTYASICALGRTFNCETVAASPYSVFAGIPVSVLGMAFYLAIGLLSAAELVPKTTFRATGFLTVFASVGALISVGLGVVSLTIIDSLCLACVTTYIVNFVILGFVIKRLLSTGGPKAAIVSQIRGLKTDMWPLLYLLLAMMVLIVAGPGKGFPRYWEVASWRTGRHLPHGTDDEGRPWLGADSPELVIHEYFDYDCPACRLSHVKLRRHIAPMLNRIRLVRHEAPRVSCNPPRDNRPTGRCAMVRGAQCAGHQGKYWEWNDAAVATPKVNRDYRNDDHEINLASKLDLDHSRFIRCIRNSDTFQLVTTRAKDAIKKRIRFTPAYMVDGKKLKLKELIALIDERF